MSRQPDDRSRGQAMVEFALVIPLFVLLIFALIDTGRVVVFYSELTNAARAAARVAMVNQSHDAVCGGVVQTYKCAAADLTVGTGIPASDIDAATFVDLDGNAVSPDADVCRSFGRCSASVTVDYAFSPITPLLGDLIGSIDLSATSTMQIERVYANPANS